MVDTSLPSAVGTYLHGSRALGDVVAGSSDIDLCVVVPEVHPTQLEALKTALSEAFHEEGGFDLDVVTVATAASPGDVPIRELGILWHPGSGYLVQLRAPHRDLCLIFEMCRRSGRALRGPAPSEVFALVERENLFAASVSGIEEWLTYGSIRDWPSAVLSACRAWWLAEEDELGSKTAAGLWAVERGIPLAEEAVEARHGRFSGRVEQESVRRVLETALRVVEEARSGA